ncbi:O-antigen polysaccharide polymerase Wzy, partial [Acinetobacter baumannii]|nr:O-antigen polysaccharide polymerase Wzy [Acinetobacter baumannii]
LSFSQYLMYKISPGLFYEGYGLGWSLLGDFYAFSFGFIFLFMIYNYFWGKPLFFISNKVDKNII